MKTYDLGGEVHEILKHINISHKNANVGGKCVSLSAFATTENYGLTPTAIDTVTDCDMPHLFLRGHGQLVTTDELTDLTSC